MRVLLIDVNCKSSSTGQIVYNLYSYLNSRGDEAAVCYGRGENIVERNIYKFGLDWETYLHALLTRITGFTGCFSYFSTRRLIKYIEQFKPDVVHIHELHAYFVNINRLLNFLAKSNIKIVHTLHCEFSYTGKCGHAEICDKWKSDFCEHCPQLKKYVGTLWFDHTKRMFLSKKKAFESCNNLTIVTPSRWLFQRAKQSFFKNDPIFIVHNSIDTETFCPHNSENYKNNIGFGEQTKVVLSVAPNLMSENKGGHYIVKLAKRFIGENVKFILVGDSQSEPYEQDNIISLGCIYNKEKLSNLYSLADCFVICSRNENFPTTCVEALCCGTPVVGFDVGGVKETTPSDFGFFCEYGNLDELEQYIRKALSLKIDNSRLEELRTYYSTTRMCEEYYDIYKQR